VPVVTQTVHILAPSTETEGTRSRVLRWLKGVGEAVESNEPLLEIETDKVTVELAAPAGGTLSRVLRAEGEEFEPGELLGLIEAVEEGQGASDSAPQPRESSQPVAAAVPAERSTPREARAHAEVSPAVRRLLTERALAESQVMGTGPGGRITVDDVLRHTVAPSEPAAKAARADSGVTTVAASREPVRRVEHSAIRRRIAEHMVESLRTAPHVTSVFEADLSAVLAHRECHREECTLRGSPLTLTAYFLAAAASAIREVPEVNSRWTAEAVEIFEAVHIGIATAVPGAGLVVPVLRNVETRSLWSIAEALQDLVGRARTVKLVPAEVRGATFTVSNHGVGGSLLAAPIIIPQPQSAILGVGKLEKRAVVVTEEGVDRIVVRPRCYVTLTIDHRVMDGHEADRFLTAFVRRLEQWPPDAPI
jgi:2-oxoglutarate dehydrogenase E2 component (dihydrolipoamide succinyltransferase)